MGACGTEFLREHNFKKITLQAALPNALNLFGIFTRFMIAMNICRSLRHRKLNALAGHRYPGSCGAFRYAEFIRKPEGFFSLTINRGYTVCKKQVTVRPGPGSIMTKSNRLKLKNKIIAERTKHAQIFIITGHHIGQRPQHGKNTGLFAALLL